MLIVGDYPGDGLEKPVDFPPPEEAVENLGEGLPYLNLIVLIELKLARGMTAKHRLQELADVIQLNPRDQTIERLRRPPGALRARQISRNLGHRPNRGGLLTCHLSLRKTENQV